MLIHYVLTKTAKKLYHEFYNQISKCLKIVNLVPNKIVKYFTFMKDGGTPHRTEKVFKALLKVFETQVIGLGNPKFSKDGKE